PETEALRGWIATEGPVPVSSDLARTELQRAVRRVAPDRMVQARAVLDSITLITIGAATFAAAGRLDPVLLPTLDAVHLACALELADDLTGMVTYDARLAQAAQAQGIAVVAPA